MQGWLTGCWWLTAVPQLYVKFREGYPQQTVFLIPTENGWLFAEKGNYRQPNIIIEKTYRITREELTEQECQRLWLSRNYEDLLEALDKPSLEKAALVYGELGLPTYGRDANDCRFTYSSQLGLVASK